MHRALRFSDLFTIGHTRVNRIGDTSCFVSLMRKEHKDLVLTTLALPDGCTVQTYHAFRNACLTEKEVVESSEAEHLNSGTGFKTKKRNLTKLGSREIFSAKRRKDSSSELFEVSNDWE